VPHYLYLWKNVPIFLFDESILNEIFSGMPSH
jgi:hypothetical protein